MKNNKTTQLIKKMLSRRQHMQEIHKRQIAVLTNCLLIGQNIFLFFRWKL